MSEEANAAAGLVAELERLRTDNAELRASAELMQQQWRALVAERTELCRQLDLAHDEIATLRDARAKARRWARAWKRNATSRNRDVYEIRVQIDQKIVVQGSIKAIARTAFAKGYARGAEDTAHSLRDPHTALLWWLERYGALLPAAWRDELKEALHVPART